SGLPISGTFRVLSPLQSQATTILPAILGASANLIAVSAALIALVPFLIESARNKNPGYFPYEKMANRIGRLTHALNITLWSFGASLILALCALTCPNPLLTLFAVISFVLGTTIVVCVGTAIALMSRK